MNIQFKAMKKKDESSMMIRLDLNMIVTIFTSNNEKA